MALFQPMLKARAVAAVWPSACTGAPRNLRHACTLAPLALATRSDAPVCRITTRSSSALWRSRAAAAAAQQQQRSGRGVRHVERALFDRLGHGDHRLRFARWPVQQQHGSQLQSRAASSKARRTRSSSARRFLVTLHFLSSYSSARRRPHVSPAPRTSPAGRIHIPHPHATRGRRESDG